MSRRSIASQSVLAAAALAVSLTPVTIAGQTAGAGAAATSVPRTPWGHPDLQGAWTNRTITPLERPDSVKGREYFTEEEAAQRDQDSATSADERGERGTQGDIGSYNAFWWERGSTLADRRTSLIVDPPNGKKPPLTPEAQRRVDEAARARAANRGAAQTLASWKDFDEYDRCIARATLPRVSTGYNNNYQIVQTPDYVAIQQEQMHEVRVIPLDGRPHAPSSVRMILGDSRGRWEGNTLVVETTNFSNFALFDGSGEGRHLVERFTRIDANTLDYQFTVTDPTVWTGPFTAKWNWNKIDAIYEYACHEGNYSMALMLSGARAEEKKAADAAASKGQTRR
jgi:hypothetical protein